MTAAPTWSILIPTLGERAALFERLMAELLPQVDAAGGRVSVIAYWNNGQPGLPEIRQRLVEATQTDYLSFIDDDDRVPEYFVQEVLGALDQRPDYVGWQTHYFANGRDHGLVDHSLRHGGWREEKKPVYRLLRDISHINPMRSEVAKAADFRVVGRGQLEDRPWVDQIRQAGELRTEVYLDKPMYRYMWDRQVSKWQRPNRIRQTAKRPAVSSSYLRWLDREPVRSEDDNRMVEDGEQRVPEPGPADRAGHGGVREQLETQGVLPGRLSGVRPQGHMDNGGSGGSGRATAGSGVRPEHALTASPGRLAVIVPTRGRPENIRKVIEAWDFTQAWDDADLILAVDADDPELAEYYSVRAELAPFRDGRPISAMAEMPRWMPMVEKLNAVALDVADRDSDKFSAIGFAGDDHLPRTMGWARRYLDVLAELGTGMVYGDDGYQGAKLSTEWAVTADAVRALGRMVPAPVEHMYCDNSMMDVFGGAGAMRHLPEIRIEHMHPVAGKAATDSQYQRVNHRDQYRKDRLAYDRWRENDAQWQIAAIRELRGDRPDVPLPAPVKTRSTPIVSSPARLRQARQRSGPSSQRVSMNRFPFTAEFKHVRGATPDEIGVTLADYAKNVPADQEIVELGVFQGRTALIMAWGARQGHGAHVTAIDPWDLPGNVYDPPFTDADSRRWAEYRINELGYTDAITLVQEFSHHMAEAWSTTEKRNAAGGKQIGLLYVDGDHTKEGARRDIEAWAPHLAPGAVIAVDDYGHPDWPGVGQAVDELVAEGFLAPVQIFYDRLAVTRLTDVIERTDPIPEPATPAREPDADGFTDGSRAGDPHESQEYDGLPVLDISAITSEGVQVETDPTVVAAGELPGVEGGTAVADLTTAQLRKLAKDRKIKIGSGAGKPAIITALTGR
jgi:predicted O-methyltransferase YrrM